VLEKQEKKIKKKKVAPPKICASDDLVQEAYENLKQRQIEEAQKASEASKSKKRKSMKADCDSAKLQISVAEQRALREGKRNYTLTFPSHEPANFECCLDPEDKSSAEDLLETMKCLATDYPACQLATDNAADAMKAYDYEALGCACELFNASLLFAKPKAELNVPTPPHKEQVQHMVNQAYAIAVKDSNALNRYKGFSDQVYGEAGFELISELIRKVPIAKDTVFLDLGSGIGQVVLQVAAQAQCKAIGVELSEVPAQYAEAMGAEFAEQLKLYNKSSGEYKLLQGSFLEPKVLSDEELSRVDVIFCNNVAFSTQTNQDLLKRFKLCKNGCKIVSMRSFEVAQAGGRGRMRTSSSSNNFKFWCPCGTLGVNQSHVRELRLVPCLQCGVYGHRKCNGVETDEQAKSFLCKSCMRYMTKQVETSSWMEGLSMDVLGPFYPEAENYVSWTSSRVGYFIHTIKKKDCPSKTDRQDQPIADVQASNEISEESHGLLRLPEQATEVEGDGCSMKRSKSQTTASPSPDQDSDATLSPTLEESMGLTQKVEVILPSEELVHMANVA